MDATRCPSCGETRWQLTGLPVQRTTECTICGEELVPERRTPGHSNDTSARADERRGASDSTPA